ncbi:long-chain-fatty-acid--CoA ligase-like [Mercenaria mercenaria]|uniref:long-chain-fatty-acid--CoA ligase-like n=1 Tax=Mercenaria mercenaria TaxID=6596 RepID=UPI00234F96DE|nr:long-chain-fatty-acid--CoA ligase-like [Mercenaria mercenaria]
MTSSVPKLSYSSCPMNEPFIYQSLPDRLRMLAEEDPAREAFVFYSNEEKRQALTRKEVLDKTVHLAKRLVHLGLEKGNKVAFHMNNSLEMLICNMAVVMAGGIPFFLSSNVKDGSDIIATIRHMEGEFMFIDANEGDANWLIMNTLCPSGHKSPEDAPSLKSIIFNGRADSSYKGRIALELLNSMPLSEKIELPVVLPEDILLYFCTSGSTGQPKEVTITHYSLFNWTKQANKGFGITNHSRFFNERSFSWIFGYPRTYLTEGATRICVDPRISVSGRHVNFLCDVIEKEQCDVIYLPAYMNADLKSRLDLKSKFKSVTTQIWGGERLSKQNITGLKGVFSRRICSFYGTTEAGGVSLFASDDIEDYEDGIIGKPLNGVEMKIVDSSGKTVPIDHQGEICTRVTWRFDGYRKMPEMFAEVVDNQGWFHTSDYGRMREDGNYVVEGRMKEVISSSGYDFFPWAIENILKRMPNAAHVIAVGVPDERLGQVVCACVVPKEGHLITDSNVQKFCDDQFISDISVKGISSKPRYVMVLDHLPLTSTGKIDRRTVTSVAITRFGIL